jgi:acyl-CoA synthetase (NDP forming)
MAAASAETLNKLINPKSIVIIGASNSKAKPGGSVTRNVMGSFKGELFLVNPKGEVIDGKASVSSLDQVPDGVDLAIIAIPAAGVYDQMKALSAKNIKTIVILTAGFGETDAKGKAAEAALVELANAEGITMIGPNVVGVVSPAVYAKFAGILPQLKEGSIDVVSASGATIDYVMEQAEMRGVKLQAVFSMGNSAQTCVEDIVAMLDEAYVPGQSAQVKMLYMEGVKKPSKLLKHARSLSEKGAILVGIKSGVSEQGSRAAASHTGALATSDTVVQALFDKAGIIRVRSKYELVEIGAALAALSNKTGIKKICAITDAGGPGVMLTDELNKWGITLPALRPETQKKIFEHIPAFGSATNPVDCLPTQTGAQIAAVIRILNEVKEDIDAVIVLTGNSGLSDKWECYGTLLEIQKESKIPVLPLLSGITTSRELIDKFKSYDKSFFIDEVLLGQALGQISSRKPLYKPVAKLANYDKAALDKIFAGLKGVVAPDTADAIMDAAGLKRPQSLVVKAKAEIAKIASTVKFPVVVKVIGPLHKSDVGGVLIGVKDQAGLEAAWDHMEKIKLFDGILIQQMVSGNEVILGAKKEEGYGHLILFGLGGIYTEVFKDSVFTLAPLGLDEAESMVRGIRAVKLLEGVRGQKGMSVPVLSDFVVRLGQLVTDFPQIAEVDFNPVKGEEDGLYVVDSRIIIEA